MSSGTRVIGLIFQGKSSVLVLSAETPHLGDVNGSITDY